MIKRIPTRAEVNTVQDCIEFVELMKSGLNDAIDYVQRGNYNKCDCSKEMREECRRYGGGCYVAGYWGDMIITADKVKDVLQNLQAR